MTKTTTEIALRNTAVAKRKAQTPMEVMADMIDEIDGIVSHASVLSGKSMEIYPSSNPNEVRREQAEQACRFEQWRRRLADVQAYYEGPEFAADLKAIEHAAWADFAEDEFIGAALKMLIGAYPMADRKELATFSALLAVDVRALHPSRYALASACQKLRRTQKFLPTISEVLEAVQRQEEHMQRLPKYIRGQPAEVPRLRAELEKSERLFERAEARAIEQQKVKDAKPVATTSDGWD